MRITGLILLSFGILTELVATGMLVFAATRPGGVELATLIVGIVISVFGASLIIGAIFLMRMRTPLGVPTATSSALGRYSHIPENHELDGSRYTVQYTPPTTGKHAQPSLLRFTTPVDLDGEFEIVPESGFDRFAKNWGLAKEINTTDEDFDQKYFVRTDTWEFTEKLLEFPENRLIIADLHRLGFKAVSMKNRELVVTWTGFNPLTDDTPDLIEEVGARLILMARRLPPDLPEPDTRAARRRVSMQIVLWIFLVGFALTIISLGFYPPIRGGELLLRAAIMLLGIFPTSLFLAAYFLSGTSRSHYAWGSWAIGALFMLPIGSVGTTALTNGMLDTSAPVVHRAKITRKYTTKNKNSISYHVEVESWREPGGKEKFSVESSDYGRVVEHQSHMIITTREGWQGIEWMVSKELEWNIKIELPMPQFPFPKN